MNDRFVRFRPPGPVTAAFLGDRTSTVRALMGPVGGGKTVTCIFDHLRNAALMPVCTDGQIHFRVAVVGVTYGQIERNLYKTWFEWLPKDGGAWTDGDFTGGGGRFGEQSMRFDVMRDGRPVRVNFHAIFAAIGENAVEEFVRGFEPTAWHLYEMDLLPEQLLSEAIGRLGRWPSQRMLPPGATYRQYVVGDLNAPDFDNWFVRDFDENPRPGFALYRQPSGLSARAENLHNLPKGYYENLAALNANKPRWVKRMIHAQYAPSQDGEPVYSEYSDDQHLAPNVLAPVAGVPIRIGMDAGLQRPAAVMGQWLPNGQWRILGEVVPGRMGAKRFADQVKQWISVYAPRHDIGEVYVDPTAFSGADREAGDLAWAETLQLELGVPILPAPSNEVGIRLDAVRDELNYRVDGDTPGLVLSRACAMLRKGFASHYRYHRERVGSSERTSDRPEKNDWSHPHDALQYLLLGSKGRQGVIADRGAADRRPGSGPARARGSTVLKSSINIFGGKK